MAVIKKASFILFADFIAAVFALSDNQAGKLFKMIFMYVNGMEAPKSDDSAVAAMFEMFRSQIDRENEKWLDKCRKNRENSHKRRCYAETIPASIGRHPPASTDNVGRQRKTDVILNDNDNDCGIDSDCEGLETKVSMKPVACESDSFDAIWTLYGKPVGDVATLREKWSLLPETDKAAIFDYVPGYVASRPEVKYRKNFENFLSQRVWENEPLTCQKSSNQTNCRANETRQESTVRGAKELMQEMLGQG